MTTIIVSIIEWFLEKVGLQVLAFWQNHEKQVEDDKQIDEKTASEAQAVKDAKTQSDQDKADGDLLSKH